MRTPALLASAALISFVTLISGCPGDSPDASPALDATAAQAAPAPAPTSTQTPASERRGVPAPKFEGRALDGGALSLEKLLGKRAVLWGFNPEIPGARAIAAALAGIAQERTTANFQIIGFSQGSSAETTSAFLKDAGLDIPVFLDDTGSFSARVYGRPQPAWAMSMDADGNLIAETYYFPTDVPEPEKAIADIFRGWLRLTVPGELPLAPDFSAEQFDGAGSFKLSSLRGKPVILMFFLHTCPHCHEELTFLRDELPKIDAAKRPKLIGVSSDGRESEVREELKRSDIDIFDVIVSDPDVSIRNKYGALQGVPVTLLIDAHGRITARIGPGWRSDRDPPLTRMRIAQLAGVTPPMLLSQSGYSGNDFCAVCHESEAATWELTQHATAMTTLAKFGADGRSECVTCHVVGYGKTGGFSIARPQPALENVGCETCHGRGGPHLSPNHVVAENYEPACATCHTPEHSLGFKYASFLPRVSHASLAKLSPAEKQAFIAARGKPRNDLLPENVAKVGSEACASCHASEFGKWKASAHGKNSPEIGCETCHGGGADHVAEGAPKKGTITSLADKCGSCAMTQLCGSCHSAEREPDFQFHMREKIEAQRHSDRPLQGLVSRELPKANVAAVLEAAFAPLAGGR